VWSVLLRDMAVSYTEFRGLSREALLRVVARFPETQTRLRARAVWVALGRHILALTAKERGARRSFHYDSSDGGMALDAKLGVRGHKPDFLDLVYRAVCAVWHANDPSPGVAACDQLFALAEMSAGFALNGRLGGGYALGR
jgi:hypothetical protein